eukprot:SAG31_NODE_3632_length_4047_cov_1.708207_4_plen_166_part_00
MGSPTYTDYPHEWVPAGPLGRSDSWSRQGLIAGASCMEQRGDGHGCRTWGNLVNVTIDGGGVVDGQGHAWWWASDAGSPAAKERPDMLQLALVDGLTIRGVTIRASPNWSVHPLLCNNVLAEQLTIESGQFDSDQEYQVASAPNLCSTFYLFLPDARCLISGPQR